eukprot:8782421-Pyramimonas_sp.AAC.1
MAVPSSSVACMRSTIDRPHMLSLWTRGHALSTSRHTCTTGQTTAHTCSDQVCIPPHHVTPFLSTFLFSPNSWLEAAAVAEFSHSSVPTKHAHSLALVRSCALGKRGHALSTVAL